MARERRTDSKTPEDEGIPDFDEDLRKRRIIDHDEDLPVPGDRPLAAFDRVTPADQREDESINTRLAREVPDVLPETHEHPGRIVEPTDEDGNDVIKELVADETDDTAALAPEEAALHLVEEDDEL